MTRTARHRIAVLAAVAFVLAIAGGLVSPFGAADEPSAPLGALAPLSEVEAGIVSTALQAFGEAGLILEETPAVSFHTDKSDCAGNLGFWANENGSDRVRICWTHDDRAVQARLQTQALIHELAHVWAHDNVGESDRVAFAAIVEVEDWDGRDVSWADRGTEVAAELLTWAVLDPAVLFIDVDGAACRDWAAAYEVLTGMVAPPHVAADCR